MENANIAIDLSETEACNGPLTEEARRLVSELLSVAHRRQASIEPQIFNLARFVGSLISTLVIDRTTTKSAAADSAAW